MRFRHFLDKNRAPTKRPAGPRYATAYIDKPPRSFSGEKLAEFYETLSPVSSRQLSDDDITLARLETLAPRDLRILKRKLALLLHPDRSSERDRKSNETRLAEFNACIDKLLADSESK